MLAPKRTKFSKYHKLRVKTFEYKSTSSYKVIHGFFGLQASENGLVTPQQIEAVRRTIVRNLGAFGKVWIRIFPHFVITSKPKEVRMGRGKGDFKTHVAKVKKGSMLFEASGAIRENCLLALRKAATKLPVKCVIVPKGL
jgi:large subunit ribosomal protein L16